MLVDFWTYSCINCIRTLPYLIYFDKQYRDKGLVIIGVHTPEFDFEKNSENVRKAVERDGIHLRLGRSAIDVDPKLKTSYTFNMESFWRHDVMATLTIKNMPDTLYQDLKQQAMLNHRSLNSEAIVSLTLVVDNKSVSAQNILLKARALRIKENTIINLTDEIINNAKQQGRL